MKYKRLGSALKCGIINTVRRALCNLYEYCMLSIVFNVFEFNITIFCPPPKNILDRWTDTAQEKGEITPCIHVTFYNIDLP